MESTRLSLLDFPGSQAGGCLSRRSALALLGTGALTTLAATAGASAALFAAAGDDDLHWMGIEEIARLVRSRKISPVDLTRRMLDRIQKIDPALNSYATVMTDHAMEAAAAAERDLAAGKYRGPLHGVPIAVKDLCFTRGVRTMAGTRVLRDFVPDEDATVVARIRAAGGIVLGKLNLTEGAMAGYHRDLGIPLNPWNTGRWAVCRPADRAWPQRPASVLPPLAPTQAVRSVFPRRPTAWSDSSRPTDA